MNVESMTRSFGRQVRRIKKASPSNKLHRIGEHEIVLTGQHELPLHQLHHKLHDCFPMSLGFAHREGWIVDIGANVGDTAARSVTAREQPLIYFESEVRDQES